MATPSVRRQYENIVFKASNTFIGLYLFKDVLLRFFYRNVKILSPDSSNFESIFCSCLPNQNVLKKVENILLNLCLSIPHSPHYFLGLDNLVTHQLKHIMKHTLTQSNKHTVLTHLALCCISCSRGSEPLAENIRGQERSNVPTKY